MKQILFSLLLVLALSLQAAVPGATVLVEGEDFQFSGNWMPVRDSACSNKSMLQTTSSSSDALTLIHLPAAGTYQVWTRSRDFTKDAGKRLFRVVIDGEPMEAESGRHGVDGWAWEKVGERELSAGDHIIGLRDTAKFFGRCDAILLTTTTLDPSSAKLPELAKYRITPGKIALSKEAGFPALPTSKDKTARQIAEIGNERVRIIFSEAKDGEGRSVIRRDTELRRNGDWKRVPVNAEEKLFLLKSAKNNVATKNYFPFWSDGAPIRFEAGGRTYETSGGRDPFTAGVAELLVPRSCRQIDAHTVEMKFESPLGQTATGRWALLPDRDDAKFDLTFTASEAGYYSVGFTAFQSWSEDQVEFNLLSPLYQSQRRPEKPLMIVSAVMPHPLALVQVTPPGFGERLSFSVVADPEKLPFEWPMPGNSNYGFSLLNESGRIQPVIFSPILGYGNSHLNKGEAKTVSWSVLVRPGDWKESLAYASDRIFHVTDYREPQGTSLTDTALNMMDLMKSDEFSGWDDRLKGFYNIESIETVTQAAPLAVLSAAVLTNDEELYETRALPSLAFMLSRPSAHFAAGVPKIEQSYVNDTSVTLTGPSRFYGTSLWQGADQLLSEKNPWLAEIALDNGKARHSTAYNSMPYWSELLAAYRLKPDPGLLEQIRAEADKFLEKEVYGKHTGDLGTMPFYNISFYPYWWDLPDLYELTGDKKYLKAAEEGAFYTMAGQWSQPMIPKGEVTIHRNNELGPDFIPRLWWKGGKEFRLGWPPSPGALAEKQAPAWLVSQVGLGFEQPVTYYGGGQGGFGNILMSSWAPNLLRMYGYTGQDIYRTYARNTIIGRFGNYPGYYMRGFTDLTLSPDYPMKGPDVTSIYYHHIPPHLAFTLDYIVTDAEVRSKGAIHFPYAKQQGYVWFSNRVFGGEAGEIYGDKDMRLWLDRTAFRVNNSKVDYFGARSADRFSLVMMNQTGRPVTADVVLDAARLGLDPKVPWRLIVDGKSLEEKRPFDGKVEISANGLVVLSFPTRAVARPEIPVLETRPITRKVGGDWGEMKAYRIRSPFANDSIYIVLTGHPQEGAKVRLDIENSKDPSLETKAFPHEFIVHPWPMDRDFVFTLALKDADGGEIKAGPINLQGTSK